MIRDRKIRIRKILYKCFSKERNTSILDKGQRLTFFKGVFSLATNSLGIALTDISVRTHTIQIPTTVSFSNPDSISTPFSPSPGGAAGGILPEKEQGLGLG